MIASYKNIFFVLCLSTLSTVASAIDVNFTLKNSTEFPVSITNEGQAVISHSQIPYHYCQTSVESNIFNEWLAGNKYEFTVEPGKTFNIGKIIYPWACSYPFETTFKFNFSRKMEQGKPAKKYDCEFTLKMNSKFLGRMEIESLERASTSSCNLIVNQEPLKNKVQTNDIEIALPVFAKSMTKIKETQPCTASANIEYTGTNHVLICPKGRITFRLPNQDGATSSGVDFTFRERQYSSNTQNSIKTSSNFRYYNPVDAETKDSNLKCTFFRGNCRILVFASDRAPDGVMHIPAKGAYISVENTGDGVLELIKLDY